MNWCIKGCKELSDLLRNGTNVVGDEKVFYYFHKGATNDYLNSTNWNCSGNPQGEIISVEEFKFRCIDEFIVDCSNNTIEERQEVLKFLVDYRGYNKYYLDQVLPNQSVHLLDSDNSFTSTTSTLFNTGIISNCATRSHL